jgi:glyoxylase-like metal-dependent hydrolase (beta-lactamase superfamily II)
LHLRREAPIEEKRMRKLAFVFVLAVAVLLVVPCAPAQQTAPDLSKVQIKVHQLAAKVFMLQGQGASVGMGNIGVLVGDDGIVLVDCNLAELGPRVEAALKTISDKPVRYVVNTHWHGDHVGGNSYFGKKATIIAQDNVRTKMQTVPDRRITDLAVSLPVLTFDKELTLHVNGTDVRAVYFPRGHTDGDSVVFFPQTNVVHMGDDLTNFDPVDLVNFEPTRFPAVNWENDASGGVEGPIAAAEYVLSKMPDDVKIIPGHGDLTSKKYLTNYLALLKTTSAAVQSGIDHGETLAQLKQEKALAKWDYLEKGGGMKTDAYLERLYHGLAGKSGAAKAAGP